MQRRPTPRTAPRKARPASPVKPKGQVSSSRAPKVVTPRGKASGRTGGKRMADSLNETREWMQNFIKWDARTATILLLVVFAFITLAPNVQNWFVYRQKIADMAAQVEEAKQSLKDMTVERKRWDDPAYVRAQARQRLYYVLPGEVSYLVMDAGSVNTSDTSGTVGAALADKRNTTEISQSIRSTSNNWVDIIGGSVIRAGIEQPTPEPTPSATPKK